MCTAESSQVSLSAIAQELKTLTDEERAALRASRFHSAPAPPSTRRSRFAHPGGALATNKAAALAKFLKRKLEEDGAATLDPALVERAVENAKVTSQLGASVVTVGKMRHVDSFSDTDEAEDEKFKCKTLNEGGSTGQVRSKKNVKGKKVNKSHNVDHLRRLKVKAGKKRKKRK